MKIKTPKEKIEINYSINCGCCKKCTGLLKKIICPICQSTKARESSVDGYWECENGHKYFYVEQIDIEDISRHQKQCEIIQLRKMVKRTD